LRKLYKERALLKKGGDMPEQAAIPLRLKDLSQKPELLAGGHRMCAGCVAPTAVRQILLAVENPVVASNATGCLEVSTSIYPYTAWRIPWIHSAFENAAATIAGVEAMYNSLQRQGKLRRDKRIDFIAFAGDGGTYDIGIQALSGAIERGHRFLYVCYDNGAYMNTGIQRSSSTPLGAHTTTSPAGKVVPGKQQFRKDLTKIIIAHNIPYAAQASPSNWRDLMQKTRKALNCGGPAFLNVIAPCHRGWRCRVEEGISLARLAVDTCYWPLYEVENGVLHLNAESKRLAELKKKADAGDEEAKAKYQQKKRPLAEWLKLQGRFAHLFKPANESILELLEGRVEQDWKRLIEMDGKPV
jgi:pyruvate ferredoxin oxidoreductase beta subunit